VFATTEPRSAAAVDLGSSRSGRSVGAWRFLCRRADRRHPPIAHL